MTKRSMKLFAWSSVVVVALAACGSDEKSGSSTDAASTASTAVESETTVAVDPTQVESSEAPASSDTPTSPAETEAEAPTGETLKIALVADQTGSLAFYGGRANEGWNLALESVGGVVAGRPVEFVPVNCATPADCGADTDRVINEDGVELVLGTPGSALASAVRESANRNGIVYFESASLGDAVLPEGDAQLAFRAGPDTSLIAAGTVEAVQSWAKADGRTLTDVTAVIVNESSAGNHLSAELQKNLLEELGVTVVDTIEYEVASADLGQVAARVADAGADVMVEVSYIADSITINTSLAQRGFTPAYHVISGTPSEQQIEALGAEYMNGIVHATYPLTDTKGATGTDEFLELHESTLGGPPVDAYALTYYTSARVLFDVLELSEGKTDGESFKAAIESIDEPLGAFANGWGAQFDAHGQNERAIASVVQWQDGITCTVFPVEFAACDFISGS